MQIRPLAAALAASMALAATSAGAQQLANPGLVYTSFNVTQLSQLATEMGATFETMTVSDGRSVVLIHSPEGDFFAAPTACDATQCLGAELIGFFGSSAGIPLETLNSFNGQLAFAKAYTADGVLILSRYLTADHGIAKGNIASNYVNFTAAGMMLANFVSGTSNAISAKIETPVGAVASAGQMPVTVSFAAPTTALNADDTAHDLIAEAKAAPFRK